MVSFSKKQFAYVALILALVFSVFIIRCGSDDGSNPSSSNPSPSTKTTYIRATVNQIVLIDVPGWDSYTWTISNTQIIDYYYNIIDKPPIFICKRAGKVKITASYNYGNDVQTTTIEVIRAGVVRNISNVNIGYLYDAYFFDSQSGWLVGSNFTSAQNALKTTDGGNSWQSISWFAAEPLYAVHFVNKNMGWVAGDKYIFQTKDAGATWSLLSQIAVSNAGNCLVFLNKNTGFIIDRGRKLYRTTDGGKSWQQLLGNELFFDAVAFVDDKHGWAAGGSVFRTMDGGNTWQKCTFDGIVNDMRYHIKNLNASTEKMAWLTQISPGEAPQQVGMLHFSTNGIDFKKKAVKIQYEDNEQYRFGLTSAYFFPDSTAWATGSFNSAFSADGETFRSQDQGCFSAAQVDFVGDFGYSYGPFSGLCLYYR